MMKKIIAIGASTGGVAALQEVLSGFRVDIPAVLVVQHMPPHFTMLFAERLNSILKIPVKEAKTGDLVVPGRVLIAPGGKHMKLVNSGANLAVECFSGEKVNNVIPAADILFESVAELVGPGAIGVILTGVGNDGARGLLKMRKKGAATIGQDKDTCEIYGMPKTAYEMGAVEHVVPLGRIAAKVLGLL